MNSRSGDGDRGTALVAAIALVLLLSAAGLGLALSSALEPSITRHFETGGQVGNVAVSAVVLAAHELAGVADWTPALRGEWHSSWLDPAGDGTVVSVGPPDVTAGVLTNLAACGREMPCLDGDIAVVTEERPWGENNPRYRLIGVLGGNRFGDEPSLAPYRAAVWVGDDPAESDSDPLTDGGAPARWPAGTPPGFGRVVVRAEAFGPAGTHRTAEAVLERGPGGPRLRAWIVQ